MLNWIKRKMKRKGFTLIELVIVIAILGILIAIAVPRLGGFRDSAAERADEATAETIEKAANLYVVTHGKAGESALSESDGYPLTDDAAKKFIENLIIAGLLDDIEDYKPQQQDKTFSINYDDGAFTVKVESTTPKN